MKWDGGNEKSMRKINHATKVCKQWDLSKNQLELI